MHIKEIVSEIKKCSKNTITKVFLPNWTYLDSVQDIIKQRMFEVMAKSRKIRICTL